MKNLALIAMLFASMGLFAQAPNSRSAGKDKPQSCVKKSDKMRKAPARQVDVRKSSLKSGKAHAPAMHKVDAPKKGNEHNRRSENQMRPKSVKVDAKK